MSFRNKRVAAVIKEAIAKIILYELQDPNFGFISVTQTTISPDLKNATIYFSILGDTDQQNRTMDHLNRAKGRIRHRLAEQVTLRYLPELTFELDKLLLEERKIGKILDSLHQVEPDDNNEPTEDQTVD